MNYNQFKKAVGDKPLIYTRDLTLGKQDKQAIRNQLTRWQAKGLVIKLRRGVFILNPTDQKILPSLTYIAGQLYGPSYISLEYALSYYDFIPEGVPVLTSVTTRKTFQIDNELGRFVYQHIKKDAFRGFKMIKDERKLNFFMAEPEKAVVDFCYLNLDRFPKDYQEVFIESYRFQNLELLKIKKLISYAKIYNSRKLLKVVKALSEIVSQERGKQ